MNTLAPTSALPDTQARQQALDPTRSCIVQAPAGSGKTELLTQRYLQLLTTVEQPEQILAITFTRKAASEMRNRILQSLARARSTPRPDKAHEAQNWQLAHQALQVDQQRGWQLESHPARLRIQTIDSLNASLARRLPMLAGLGATMDIAQDTLPIYEAACERLLEQLGDGSDAAHHLERLLLHLANHVPNLMQMLCDLLARRDHWLPLLIQHRDDADLRDSIEHTLQAAIEHHLQILRVMLPADMHEELVELGRFAANNRLQEGEVDEGLAQLASLMQLPVATVDALPSWHALASLLCKKGNGQLKPELYAKVDKRHGFPADKDKKPVKDRMQVLLRDLANIPGMGEVLANIDRLPAPLFSEAQWQVLQALLHLLPLTVGHLKLEFQSRGQVDFVELSLRALQALGTPEQPTDTALALDARLQHILVDEFQDTSVTQMALLKLLTAGWSEGDGRTLFCVGDPMQSIYRFRQAEVGLFLQMQQQGLPGVPVTSLHLQTNFRSTQPIVNWVNRSFPHIMPAQDDAESGAVHYSPSQPRPDAAAAGRVQVHAAIQRTPQQEAREIRALVQAALAADATQRVAILVSGRSHVGPIARELKESGITFNAVDIERLQDRSLVQDLMALTRALLHLGDRTAWLACLRAPWCGLALSDLHALAAGAADRTIHELLASLTSADAGTDTGQGDDVLSIEARQRLQRFTQVITAALSARARLSLREWVEQTWLALHGPACLQTDNELDDADAFFARLDELETAGDLEDLTRLDEQLSTLFANGSRAQQARVEIMTIHKSKGLEFDVVILPSLHRAGGKDGTRLLRWTRLTGLDADGLVLAPPGARGDDSDRIYQWLAVLEKQRAHHESQRLLYVAATRAKRELHLFGSASLNKAGDAPRPPSAGTLLRLLWPQVEQDFVHAVLQRDGVANTVAHDPAMPVMMMLKRLPANWMPPEPAAALPGRHSNTVINAEEAPEFDWVSETGRHVGTVVHAELEWLVQNTPQRALEWRGAARRSQIVLRLAELGVPETLRESACERVVKAIERTLADARGRWILGLESGHAEAASEVALSGILHGVLVNGIIDRTVLDAGTRWIIDFKTSTHEGGGREAFLQSEVERYRGQMERYAQLMSRWKPHEPVRCALYFPLLGEWREVQT